MITDIVPIDKPAMDIVVLTVTDTEIQNLKDEYLVLKINGVEDKPGLKKVYESRQIVKKIRTGLVKYADELKEKAVVWQKKVNTEKNRVVGELESIEAHLQGEEDKIAVAKEVIRVEAEKREQERIQKMIDQLAAYGFAAALVVLQSIDDATFQKVLSDAKVEYEKELAAKAEEKRLAGIEAQKLIDDRKVLEELRSNQAAAQKIIDDQNEKIRLKQEEKEAAIYAEQKKLDDEKLALEFQNNKIIEDKKRADELEKAKADAIETARLKAIQDEANARIAEEEKLAMASDRVKFKTVVEQLSSVRVPAMKSGKSKKLAAEVLALIGKINDHILSGIK